MDLELKKSPTLQDFQSYVRQMKQERGFNTTDKFYECCLFAEEAGEVISAVRKNAKGGSVGSGSAVSNVAEELADVFIYVCSLANMHGIDLEQAFRDKEEKTSCAPGNGYRQQSGLLRVRDCFNPNCLGCGTVFEYVRDGCEEGRLWFDILPQPVQNFFKPAGGSSRTQMVGSYFLRRNNFSAGNFGILQILIDKAGKIAFFFIHNHIVAIDFFYCRI